LSRLHKEVQTQHQWRFEAVPKSTYFPFGCKTAFKAYSSNKVVEFEKLPKGQCCTKMGQYTGLEPSTLYCTWQPEIEGANSLPGRPIEGYHLLTKLLSSNVVNPKPFSEGTAEKTLSTLEEVWKRLFGSDIAEEWKLWGRTFAPRSDSAEDYLRNLRSVGEPFHVPLRELIFVAENVISRNWVLNNNFSEIDPSFVYPEIIKAAMNSVVSRWNPDPQLPRLSTSTDTELVQNLLRYKDNQKKRNFSTRSLC